MHRKESDGQDHQRGPSKICGQHGGWLEKGKKEGGGMNMKARQSQAPSDGSLVLTQKSFGSLFCVNKSVQATQGPTATVHFTW